MKRKKKTNKIKKKIKKNKIKKTRSKVIISQPSGQTNYKSKIFKANEVKIAQTYNLKSKIGQKIEKLAQGSEKKGGERRRKTGESLLPASSALVALF